MSWFPQIGATGVTGAIVRAVLTNNVNNGFVVADQVQGVAGTQYAGKSNIGKNPLVFEFGAELYGLNVKNGQRVTFSIAAGEFSPYATNVQLA